MNREKGIAFLDKHPDFVWDLVVIGGGATGLGTALDAAARGYKTLLLEQADFTKGTSSRSTKLVHGGVRYLAQGDVQLVLEALYERGLLLQNAPHLTSNQSFVVPSYSWWDGWFYTIGLKLYDLLSGKLSLGKSERINAEQVKQALPTVQTKGLKTGIVYHDGQFDDARLGINIAQTAVELGATVLNYMRVSALRKTNGKVGGVDVVDLEKGKTYAIFAKAVVNATGIFVDNIIHMDDASKPPLVRPSQGTHIVLDAKFLPSHYALMIPKTSDGRVLFAVPWHGKLVVGTTDSLIDQAAIEPMPMEQEVDFILANFNQYTTQGAKRSDIRAVFAGLRPLARPQKEGTNTKEISRSHKLIIANSGLVTIIGGKWTTFRKMAEDTVNAAIHTANLENYVCATKNLKIHGYSTKQNPDPERQVYGSDWSLMEALLLAEPSLADRLHPDYSYLKVQVVWAARHEMARTIEDVLARRLRILFLDAKAAMEMAPIVGTLLQQELNKDEAWAQDQLKRFLALAQGYLLSS